MQFKAARRINDPPEVGLEVVKDESGRKLADVVKSFEETQGFLGGFASQGVVYVRVMDANLAEIRSVLFADDPRYNEANMKIKILFKFRIGGFTAGASFQMVFTTLQSVGWVVIPLRIWHSNELATVIVGSDKRPPETKFITTQGVILIDEADSRSSGFPKGSAPSRAPVRVVSEDPAPFGRQVMSSTPEDPWIDNDRWNSPFHPAHHPPRHPQPYLVWKPWKSKWPMSRSRSTILVKPKPRQTQSSESCRPRTMRTSQRSWMPLKSSVTCKRLRGHLPL